MLSVPHYVILWCILFIILGTVWYILDRRFGVHLYRWWYDLTHEEPLPEAEIRGFVYNRSTKARVSAALLVSTVQSLLVLVSSQVNLLVELIMWVFEVPVTFIGFYLGPWAYRLWRRRDDFFEAVDRVEQKVETGQIDLAAVAKSASDQISDRAKELLDDLGVGDESKDEAAEQTPAASAAEVEARADDEPVPEEDPRELIRKYSERGHGGNGKQRSD